MTKLFVYHQAFPLEEGGSLPHVEIAYTTYGNVSPGRSNTVWICHALTANAAPTEWWPGMIGKGLAIDPDKHFIVCANVLGSCYGSSGPLSTDPSTGKPYYSSFPPITIRDMVKAHILLRKHLHIEHIQLLIGGSMGGYQAIEWALMEPSTIKQLFLLATSATESAWGIAVHTAQRLALTADPTWNAMSASAGKNGLKAARAIGMLTYRNYDIMVKKQTDTDTEKFENFAAASYIEYQGQKLAERFNAYSYWLLSRAMDSHHIARARNKRVNDILKEITQPTLITGISSDILCPLVEQQHMAKMIPGATFVNIDSAYGHDGFLVEVKKISAALLNWVDWNE